VYVTSYRKDGQKNWKRLPETEKTWQIITSLTATTRYEIVVAAKYKHGKSGPPSDPVTVQTEKPTGKCHYTVVL